MAIDSVFPPPTHDVSAGAGVPIAVATVDEKLGIPRAFCWTRIGTEAGESIELILARKEAERQANHGIFLWGIGNSVAPGLRELLERGHSPEVLFSRIKGRPRNVDVTPPRVVNWTAGETMGGDAVELAPSVRVLSRAPAGGNSSPHYALVCFSLRPLAPADHGSLQFGSVRNLLSGSRLGASQVTAVVAHHPTDEGGAAYPIVLRAHLVAPYFLRLRGPRPILQIA